MAPAIFILPCAIPQGLGSGLNGSYTMRLGIDGSDRRRARGCQRSLAGPERVEILEFEMAVKLRLKRFGRSHRAYYRVSAMDSRSPRDGRVLEELGTYDPVHKDPAQQVRLDADRIKHWLRHGAVPTDTVRDLLKKAGITAS